MPELILEGFVRTETGPERFEVFRVDSVHGGAFTVVDQLMAAHGWVTLNGPDSGLAAFAAAHGAFYRSLDDYARGHAVPFPPAVRTAGG